jgi:hypothetical protein
MGLSTEIQPILGSFQLKRSNLGALRVTHSLSLAALLKIKLLVTLTSVSITLPHDVTAEHLQHSIGTLKALETLEVHQSPDTALKAKGRSKKRAFSLQTGEGLNNALCRTSSLKNLRTLTVDGDSIAQDMTAATLSPQCLETLHFIASGIKAENMVRALTVHLQRNKTLVHLSIRVAEGELDAKGQSWFVSVDTIFQEIGALRNLRKLWIEGIPTLGYKRVAADFAKTVLPNLAVLEELVYIPDTVSKRKRHHLPRLETLLEVQKHSKHLKVLDMAFLLPKKAPDTSPKHVSKHCLRNLSIRGASKRGDDGAKLAAVIDVARFLDMVFPHLRKVTVECIGSKEEKGFGRWDQIEGLVLMNQEMRTDRGRV